jgi:hypothetical protein
MTRDQVVARLIQRLLRKPKPALGATDFVDALILEQALMEAYDAGVASVRAEVEPLRTEADRQGRVLADLTDKLTVIMAELEQMLGARRVQ